MNINLKEWEKKYGILEEQSIFDLKKLLKKKEHYDLNDNTISRIKKAIKVNKIKGEEFFKKWINSGAFHLGIEKLKRDNKVPVTSIGNMKVYEVDTDLSFEAMLVMEEIVGLACDTHNLKNMDDDFQEEFKQLLKANTDETRFNGFS